MYEEWFEKLAKKLGIERVIDGKNSVDIILPSEVSSKIDGEELFNESYGICKNFRFSYSAGCIHIILDKVNLDKHYLMYLIAILIKVKGMVNRD